MCYADGMLSTEKHSENYHQTVLAIIVKHGVPVRE